jgi:hypothetical protein
VSEARFAVQFFNWYWAGKEEHANHLNPSEWTFEPDWSALGTSAEDVGKTREYYHQQFLKIREVGFDSVMWEWHNPWPANRGVAEEPAWPWHGGNLPPEAIDAARAVGLQIGMFYDMEIRFRSFPSFIQPTPPMAERMVDDIVGFYQNVPEALWLRDRNQELPIVVYGYQFSGKGSVRDWHTFYQGLLSGIAYRLGCRPSLHWTDAQKAVQIYGYQHFPQIHPFAFNPCHVQSGLGADSVTFVLGYDDYGVWQGNADHQGAREHDLIMDDPRLVEESLALAKATDPAFVFFYGWNELYEGEAILPDLVHGDARMALAQDVIRTLRVSSAPERSIRPRVVCDDVLKLAEEKPSTAEMVITALQRLRVVLPEADYHEYAPMLKEAAPLTVYLGEASPPMVENGEALLWITSADPPSTLPQGVTVVHTWEAALRVLEERGWTMAGDGVLFTARWTRVSKEETSFVEGALPNRLLKTSLPGGRWVMAAPRALKESRHRLPTGWNRPTFRWIRGTPRNLEIDEEVITLRYPEVVEVRRTGPAN